MDDTTQPPFLNSISISSKNSIADNNDPSSSRSVSDLAHRGLNVSNDLMRNVRNSEVLMRPKQLFLSTTSITASANSIKGSVDDSGTIRSGTSTSGLNTRQRSSTSPAKLMGLKINAASAHDIATPKETDLNSLIPSELGKLLKDQDVEFIEELGCGAGGTVSKVRHLPTGRILCRKNILLRKSDTQTRSKAEHQLELELKIMSICKSPYIVEALGAFLHDRGVSVCLEFMDLGSLDGVLKRVYSDPTASIPETIAVKIAVHVLKGLEYLAGLSIFHRDIKPANILLNTKGQIKIADFGIAKLKADTSRFSTTGTQAYLSLERIENGTLYTVVSDVWALGITLIEIVSNTNPFIAMSPVDMRFSLQDNDPPTLPPKKNASGGDTASGYSRQFEELVSKCLVKDYMNRPGPTELLQIESCVQAMQEGILLTEWCEGLKHHDVPESEIIFGI